MPRGLRVSRRPAPLPRHVRIVLERRELRTIQDAYDVGRALVEGFHGGDEAAFRSRKRSQHPLREIVEQLGGRPSIATLWRAASVYVLAERWPALLQAEHLRLSHVYSVLDLAPRQQVRLLDQAERKHWSRQLLLSKATRHKRRRRSAPHRADTAAGLRSTLSKVGKVLIPSRSSLPPGSAPEVASLLRVARKRLDRVTTWLADQS